MKKPYLKKVGVFNGYNVWYVNGYYIRNNLDKEFTNFGSNRYFHFIPKHELWIDYENGKKEARFFIDNFLMIQKELKNGHSYNDAVNIANRHEGAERSKSKHIIKLKKIKNKEKLVKKVHMKRIFSKYTKNIKIWIVRGDLVRSLFYIDFTEGGHDKVYHFVPKHEIWIDDEVYKKEIPYVLIHELHERFLMGEGWEYDSGGVGVFSRKPKKGTKSAHFEAEKLEAFCREHPKQVKTLLIKAIKNNDKQAENDLK
ncbi:hypothetical protein J4218_01650 [Candidatus Pacearchaeota archaeon]|nr:hypothetical protein [uncultured archaeon]MBS3078803.1 hypothetical protein [Candidatus Pacearchaeota archaeon]